MRDPTQAAHAVGKLLKRVGDRNVLWGTDEILLGPPQPQIQALRAFNIRQQFQEQFGYPALTDEIKRQVFGLNAASLFPSGSAGNALRNRRGSLHRFASGGPKNLDNRTGVTLRRPMAGNPS